MANRKFSFTTDEYYHIYNRGVDKRTIVQDQKDSMRFLTCLKEFNTDRPIESLHNHNYSVSRHKTRRINGNPLVEVIAYCLNPNHFHLIVKQTFENGVSLFMKKVLGGYTWYFNNKYKRTGSLFQGKFKASHITNNEYLLHVVSYVNLNQKVHFINGPAIKLTRSSWKQYSTGDADYLPCSPNIVLAQFNNRKEYAAFAKQSLALSREKKEEKSELELILMEND